MTPPQIWHRRMRSPIGWLCLEGGPNGIKKISLRGKNTPLSKEANRLFVSPQLIKTIERWLFAYFERKKKDPFPWELLDLSMNTPFQGRVLKLSWKIPFGETRSYGWMAKKLGLKGGGQAVGQANKRNPLPIVIPCHRVIAADGSLGGYAPGLLYKRKLLRHEGTYLEPVSKPLRRRRNGGWPREGPPPPRAEVLSTVGEDEDRTRQQ